jgi:N-methylhydantoinase A
LNVLGVVVQVFIHIITVLATSVGEIKLNISLYTRIDEFDYAAVNTLLHDLTAEAETFVRQGTDAELVIERQVSMRYKGQGWEIPVRLSAGDFDVFAAENLGGVFTKAYEEFFGRAIADLPIEAVSWSVRVASVQQRPAIQQMLSATRVVSATSHRDIYDPVARAQVSAGIVERDTLEPGDALVGATIIVEPQTTTILGSHHQAVLQSDGSLLITRINEGDAA